MRLLLLMLLLLGIAIVTLKDPPCFVTIVFMIYYTDLIYIDVSLFFAVAEAMQVF